MNISGKTRPRSDWRNHPTEWDRDNQRWLDEQRLSGGWYVALWCVAILMAVQVGLWLIR